MSTSISATDDTTPAPAPAPHKSFAELHAAIAAILAAEKIGPTFSVRVEAWQDGQLTWTAWLAEFQRHVSARTPVGLLELVRVACRAPEHKPMTVGEVVL